MKADPTFIRYLRGLGPCRLVTSVVVEGEIRFGLLRMPAGRKRAGLTRAWLRVVSSLHEVLPLSRPVARQYGRLKSTLGASGRPAGENDLWIAATALAHGTVLVTRDAGLAALPGLRVDDWTRTC